MTPGQTPSPLIPCAHCRGFVTAADERCPHCERSLAERPTGSRARLLGLLAACGGGALAVTLMACYGIGPCYDGSCDPPDFATPTDAADGGSDGGQRDGGCGDGPCGDGGKG